MTNMYDSEMYTGTDIKKEIYEIQAVMPVGGVLYRLIKRIFDILFSVTVTVVTLPVMLVLAVVIRHDSPGGAIYSQARLGKDGKEFKIFKFRTMVEDAEKDAPVWAEDDDPRCTRVGRVLRKYRLDELPQMYNILLGQMSFVGPRPERQCFYEEFEKYIHGFKNRLVVKPGLTGLAQVNGGYNLKPEEKIVYDMEYIGTRTIWLDIKIILKTAKTVFKKEGAK